MDNGERGLPIKIAVVEDDDEASVILSDFLDRYADNNKLTFDIARFTNGVDFLSRYRKQFDMVMMDIDLKSANGMDIAKKLRETDPFIIIVFVTNLAQYAVKGYEVDALDFIVKPVRYEVLALKLDRAIKRLARKDESGEVCITTGNNVFKIKHSNIKYIEITGHRLVYHTADGNFKAYGTLKNIERELDDHGFKRCNNCYYVNLKYVTKVIGYDVTVDGEVLQISRPKRAEFVRALNAYMSSDG